MFTGLLLLDPLRAVFDAAAVTAAFFSHIVLSMLRRQFRSLRSTHAHYYPRSPFSNPTETYRYYSLPFCQVHAEDQPADSGNIEVDDDRYRSSEAALAAGRQRGLAPVRRGGLKHKQRMGESIVGDRRETSPYDISFLDSVDWRVLCKKILLPADLEQLKDAIHNNYFFEMFVEDLPMWGYIGDVSDEDFIIGEVSGSKTYLFPHLHFYFGYNNDQIVAAKVTTDVRCRPTD